MHGEHDELLSSSSVDARSTELRVVREPLTARELDVLEWLATPLTLRRIADELFVSYNTVRTHCRSIFRKLGVSNRYDAVVSSRSLHGRAPNRSGDRSASLRERELANKEREMAHRERAVAASAHGTSRNLHQQVARVHDQAADLHDRLAGMDERRERPA